MIQILNYNLIFFQNSAFNSTFANHCTSLRGKKLAWRLKIKDITTLQCLCWCYFTNLVALGRKTVNTRVEHILFLLPAIVGMAKMAWWDSHVLQLCLSVFCHQVKTGSNTNLESKLVCYQITTHFLCHPCFKTQLRALCNKPP